MPRDTTVLHHGSLVNGSLALGTTLVLLAGGTYGGASILIKLAYRQEVGVETLVAVRFAGGMLILWSAALLSGSSIRLAFRQVLALLLMGIVLAVTNVLFFGSLRRIPAGLATLLLYTYPLLVVVLARVFRSEPIVRRTWVSVLLGSVGVTLVVRLPTHNLALLGMALALGSAVTSATYILMAQRVRSVPPLVASAVVMTGGGMALVPSALIDGSFDVSITTAGWGYSLGVAALMGTGTVLFFNAVSRIGPIRASIGSAFELGMVVVLAALLLDEVLSVWQVIGVSLVLVAVVVIPFLQRGESASR